MSEMMIWISSFNPEMLVLARARAGKTQSQIGRQAEISQAILSKIERGMRLPTQTEVLALARVLEVPTSFFERDEQMRFYSAPPLFRLRRRVSQLQLEQLNAEFQSRAMHLREMLASVEMNPSLPLPTDLGVLAAEEAAMVLRRRWLIRAGPIANLTKLIEAAGIFVVELECGVSEFEGCAFRGPGLPTMIFVRKGQPADRRRFTLAHELGHLLLHETPRPDLEMEANHFAQTFLFPTADAIKEIGAGPRLEVFRRVKRTWGISIQSGIMRAGALHLVTPVQKSRLFKELTIRGWRTEEPDEPPPELPRMFERVLSVMRDDLRFSLGEFAHTMRELQHTISAMYGWPSAANAAARLSMIK